MGEDTDAVSGDAYTHIERVVEYENPWYSGGYDELQQPDGSTKKYYWADLPDAVTVVAPHQGDIIFTRQYRPAADATHLECPSGIVEDGETFAAAGARELREETGFEADSCTCIQVIDVATGVLRHQRGIVVADGLTETGHVDRDANEFLTVERVPQADALGRARADPANGSTIEALCLAQADGYL